MKSAWHTAALIAALLFLPRFSFAFDPSGPPPEWTVSETARFVTTVKRPQVQFGSVTLEELFELLIADRPAAYSPKFTADVVFLKDHKTTFSMDLRDATALDVLLLVAERLKADILISAGAVKIAERNSPPRGQQ